MVTGFEQYKAALQTFREGRKSESQDLLTVAYLTLAAEQRLHPVVNRFDFQCLLHIAAELRPSDEPFLKNIQSDTKAPTHHRALAAFARGNILDLFGSRGEAASLYRKTISLCDKITPAELDQQVFYAEVRAKVSIREYLAMSSSILTAAKLNLDARNITQYYAREETARIKAEMGENGQELSPAPSICVTGPFFSETRKDAEAPRFHKMIFNRSPGHQCDGCDVLSRVVEEGGPESVVRLKKCRQCLFKHYCSPACQRTAWKTGHKTMCRPLTSLVEFDLVRVHGLQNAKHSTMNGNIFEIRGSAPTSSGDDLKWIVSYLGGGNEVVVKHANLSRVMFKEERWNWEALETEFSR
ncbi:hypothetical protein HDU98_003395 [Podochytrium sp. JEL0797]|nr:hypothetical protein HDU98_003395 [Podochytrium sp. JEL0797]